MRSDGSTMGQRLALRARLLAKLDRQRRAAGIEIELDGIRVSQLRRALDQPVDLREGKPQD